MEFDEKTYEKWFDDNLGEVESKNTAGDESPLRYQPRLHRNWVWILLLAIIMIASAVISYFIYEIAEWVSSLLLSISTGMLASIILMLFTTSRDKFIQYNDEIIPLLEYRHEKIYKALYFPMVRLQIARQRYDIDEYFDLHKLLANTQCVATDFIEYLNETLRYKPKYLKECASKKEEYFKTCKDYTDKVYELYNNKNIDLFAEIEKLEMQLQIQTDCVLYTLQDYIEDLSKRNYRYKFNTKKNLESDFDLKEHFSTIKKKEK